LPADDGFQKAGQICAANESRFAASHYSWPLTDFSVGWAADLRLQSLVDFLAPPVPAGRRFSFKKGTNAKYFYSETDDVRAVGSAFKRIEYGGTHTESKTLNKGLTIRVDHDEQMPGFEGITAKLLIHRLLLNELRRAIALLAAAASNKNLVWTFEEESNVIPNPDKDVRDALSAAANSIGFRPNNVAYGETAWNKRADAYNSRPTKGDARLALLSPPSLAGILAVERCRMIDERYQSSASVKTPVLANIILYFYGTGIMAKDDPSNCKRFVTPFEGGGNFRVYLDEREKFTDLTVEHYSNIIITTTTGLGKLTIL